jgi:hypothetical protein
MEVVEPARVLKSTGTFRLELIVSVLAVLTLKKYGMEILPLPLSAWAAAPLKKTARLLAVKLLFWVKFPRT